VTFPFRVPSIFAFAVALLAAGLSAPRASATLGAPYVSVETDRAHMSAHLAVASRVGYSVHSLAAPNGDVLREFTRPDGMVFAVAWQGPAKPDLRQALGPYFEELNAANPPRTRGGRHIPLTANTSNLVVRSGGHSGAFFGTAYVPDLVPAGVSPADIQ
jgi:hypothetical protein